MKIRKFSKKIEFTNNGALSFFFIGTGSAFSKKHFQTNLLVVKGKDHLLIDCGTLASYVFSTFNTSITEVKNLLITHSHADHIGGLEEVALMGRYSTKVRPKMIIGDGYKKVLWNESLKGGCSYGEYTDGKYMTFDDYFEQIKPRLLQKRPRALYEANIGSINVKMYRTHHMTNSGRLSQKSFFSQGVLIDDRILFPGDTQFDKPLLDWAMAHYKLDGIFHDCQFFKGGVHAFYGDLKTLPSEIKSKMILCHYGDDFEKFDAKKDGFRGFAKRGIYYDFEK